MRNAKKKVMILNNLASPYISEAIIILKDYDPRFDTGAVRDAERIINEYMNKNNPDAARKPRSSKRLMKCSIAFILMCLCFATGYFFNH
ncbi:MAG: hypothetical protein LUD03_07140 [Firmicutes bacterium]|nr:hypothetical protein [Bacillota bacterium]